MLLDDGVPFDDRVRLPGDAPPPGPIKRTLKRERVSVYDGGSCESSRWVNQLNCERITVRYDKLRTNPDVKRRVYRLINSDATYHWVVVWYASQGAVINRAAVHGNSKLPVGYQPRPHAPINKADRQSVRELAHAIGTNLAYVAAQDMVRDRDDVQAAKRAVQQQQLQQIAPGININDSGRVLLGMLALIPPRSLAPVLVPVPVPSASAPTRTARVPSAQRTTVDIATQVRDLMDDSSIGGEGEHFSAGSTSDSAARPCRQCPVCSVCSTVCSLGCVCRCASFRMS
jgi:hypothetical protein